MIYTSEQNNKAYKQLNRLVIAKLTSNPDYTILQSLGLTCQQQLRATRHINRIQRVKTGV